MNPNIQTQANCQVQGYFKLEAVQGDDNGTPIPGTERVVMDWTPNLITDNGMELLKGNAFLNYIMVGSGSAVPAKTDTTLGAFVAGMVGSVSQGPNDFTPTDFPWCSAQTTCQFAKGVAAGNLSEIGVGATQTNMFARALIKDTNGNPTTITVTSIELLTVTYQWRVYFDLTYSHTDSFVIGGTTYTTTTVFGQSNAANAYNWNIYGPKGYGSGVGTVNIFTGAANAPGVSPTGLSSSEVNNASFTAGPAGSAYGDLAVHAGTTKWNGTIAGWYGGHVNVGACPIKASVSPALVKDNTMELDITMRIAWARKVP